LTLQVQSDADLTADLYMRLDGSRLARPALHALLGRGLCMVSLFMGQ